MDLRVTEAIAAMTRNMDNLKTLLDRERDEYQFIGLSLSDAGLAEYVTKNELKFPVYSGLSPDTLKTSHHARLPDFHNTRVTQTL